MLKMEKICMTEEVPERESRAYDTMKGTTIFITQKDGSFYAYQNVCPHLQTELEYLENQFLDQVEINQELSGLKMNPLSLSWTICSFSTT